MKKHLLPLSSEKNTETTTSHTTRNNNPGSAHDPEALAPRTRPKGGKYPARPQDEADTRPSRSQKKRDSTALQQRGEELAALSPGLRSKLPLSPELAEALNVWRDLKSREAKRRHMQYIGRLMREQDDPEILLKALDDHKAASAGHARRFAHLEQLRDALLAPSEEHRSAAFSQVLASSPALEEAQLAHLVTAALAEREKKRPPRYARELFRYLRDCMSDV